MQGDLQDLVTKTGVTLPLVASITKAIVDSGASRLEAQVALGLVDQLLHLLPITLVANGVSSPELAGPQEA